MPRERVPLTLNSPLAREREGVKLSGGSLSRRLAEVVQRLDRVVAAAMPSLPGEAWQLVCWQGWDAISAERITSEPEDVDALAWGRLVAGVADWIAGHDGPAPAWTTGLVDRLRDMSPVERIAVLERIEAYGRTEAAR